MWCDSEEQNVLSKIYEPTHVDSRIGAAECYQIYSPDHSMITSGAMTTTRRRRMASVTPGHVRGAPSFQANAIPGLGTCQAASAQHCCPLTELHVVPEARASRVYAQVRGCRANGNITSDCSFKHRFSLLHSFYHSYECWWSCAVCVCVIRTQ